MHNLLIVDDNKIFRQTLKRIIEGNLSLSRVREAASGFEALQMIREEEPDAILMDIRLQGESGLRVTERIKAERPGIRIIFITGHDSQEYREAATRIGAERFLSKEQASYEEIISTIRSVLEQDGMK
ncbi:MAG: response regulator [Desulfatiglandales bacterium]